MSEVVNLTKELLIRPSITTDDAGCQQLIAGRLRNLFDGKRRLEL